MKKIEVLIVDDHSLFRETLSYMINKDFRFRVLAGTDNADVAFAMARDQVPDIILMDINMSPVDGFKLTERLLALSPGFKIIAITMHAMVGYARTMLKIGARGYITKNTGLGELIDCMNEVHNGKKYVCSEIRNLLVSQELDGTESPLQSLSNREISIARLLKEGLSSKDIASQLQIATRTVEVHRCKILKKLNLKNTAALVNFTNFHGL